MMPDCFTPRRKFPRARPASSALAWSCVVGDLVGTCPVDGHDERGEERVTPLLDEVLHVLLHRVDVLDRGLGLFPVAGSRCGGNQGVVEVGGADAVDERGE
tara:strand:+ start:144 stop:446 length:303 start_codon:yes stop_codon:yes gene_type:complete